VWTNYILCKEYSLTFLLPASVMETFKVVLAFEPVDEILRCDLSSKTSFAVLSHGTIYIEVFDNMKFGMCLEYHFGHS